MKQLEEAIELLLDALDDLWMFEKRGTTYHKVNSALILLNTVHDKVVTSTTKEGSSP